MKQAVPNFRFQSCATATSAVEYVPAVDAVQTVAPGFITARTASALEHQAFFDQSQGRRKKLLDKMARQADSLQLQLELKQGKYDIRHSWAYWDDFEPGSQGEKLYLKTQLMVFKMRQQM